MMPGPDYIYQCPKCSNLLRKGSLWSGNTYGGELYSDGKIVAPMLPEFPNLTKCKKCDEILWLSDMEQLGTDENTKPEWEIADQVEFLGVPDLLRFLEWDSVKNNAEKEEYVRFHIWQTFNDRIREKSQIFIQKSEEVLWKQNCQRLIELCDTTVINQKIMVAELYRNLEDFDTCVDILDSVDDKSYDWVVEKLRIECENMNRYVVRLN